MVLRETAVAVVLRETAWVPRETAVVLRETAEVLRETAGVLSPRAFRELRGTAAAPAPRTSRE